MNYLGLLIIIVLVSLSGLFSGLTLGLLGLDKTDLERKIKLGNKYAKKVYSVRKKGNLLLCTLLLGNVAVNSAIAILLGNMASGFVAGVTATGLIVIFGEIIPQATISRYALQVGAKTVGIVKFFIFLLYPVCWPIAKTLDLMLGEEIQTVWSRHELKEIVKMHKDSTHSDLDADEERIILGAMTYSDKKVDSVMTPIAAAFMLDGDSVIDLKMINKIKRSGFSRIPVYKKNMNNIIGVLFTKDLLGFKGNKKVKMVCQKKKFLDFWENKKLDTVLNEFIRSRSHLALVYNKDEKLTGIITMEDVIEEIFKKEIVDEYDKVVDTRELIKK